MQVLIPLHKLLFIRDTTLISPNFHLHLWMFTSNPFLFVAEAHSTEKWRTLGTKYIFFRFLCGSAMLILRQKLKVPKSLISFLGRNYSLRPIRVIFSCPSSNRRIFLCVNVAKISQVCLRRQEILFNSLPIGFHQAVGDMKKLCKIYLGSFSHLYCVEHWIKQMNVFICRVKANAC